MAVVRQRQYAADVLLLAPLLDSVHAYAADVEVTRLSELQGGDLRLER